MPTYSVVSIGAGTTGTGTLTPALPSSHTAGDLLLLCASARLDTETSDVDPSGYTLLAASAGGGLEVWGKIDGGSEAAPSISFSGSSRCCAFVTALRSSTGWPSLATIVVNSDTSTVVTTQMRYRSLVVTQNDLCCIQVANKATTTGNVNPAVSVDLTSGYTAAGLAIANNTSAGLVLAAQIQGQTTAADLAQNDVAVNTNTDSASSRSVSLSLAGLASTPARRLMMMGVG